jgi:HTH-type transcriptional regulator, competence development regulator
MKTVGVQARTGGYMKFGQRVRSLRQTLGRSQRALASKLGIKFRYLSKIENEKLDFGDYPSEELICKIAHLLHADEDELLLLARKIPPAIRRRVMERPDAFRKFAALDDEAMNRVLATIDQI